MSQPTEAISENDHKPVVIGIGASAGGLEALRALFSSIDRPPRAAFVVVQHLAPSYRSMLSQLIGRGIDLQSKDIEDGVEPEEQVIYITPPNKDVIYKEGRLFLNEPDSRIAPKPSIDNFFLSLADELGDRAIGIILSGTGSDGTHGVRAIKAANGIVIAQSPDSAKYDGMPRSAIASGVVDHIQTPEHIASELLALVEHLHSDRRSPVRLSEGGAQSPYLEILATLKKRTNVDFTLYKPNTVNRRILRRMDANRITSIDEYRQLVKSNKEECRALYQDILINVTAFFRDSDEYEVLSKELEKLLKAKQNGEPLRIWVAGCSSGEEVYSLAILLQELTSHAETFTVQLFATDIDDMAMMHARAGLYSESALENVDLGLREKYFQRLDSQYRIKKFLREQVVFARHDLTRDPPFMKMDLISCRNLFIYFEQQVQERALRMFHYALNAGGVLFLGKSETVGATSSLYNQIGKAKIYQRSLQAPDQSFGFLNLRSAERTRTTEVPERRPSPAAIASVVIEAIAPDSVLIDDTFIVKHVYGRAGRFLSFSSGAVTHTLINLLRVELRDSVATILHRAKSTRSTVVGRSLDLTVDGQVCRLQPSVTPLPWGERTEFLVRFEEAEVNAQASKKLLEQTIDHRGELEVVKDLEYELSQARTHLQSVIEQQETSNEELQALNEELNSANEELQSTNEELETSNEELQSTNEELTTLNEELNVKSMEVVSLYEYLDSIQNAINHPLMVVDENLNLVRFNYGARSIFGLADSNLGRNIRLLRGAFEFGKAYEAIETCLRTKQQVKLEFDTNQRVFDVQADPVYGHNDALHSVVVTFVDNTPLVKAYRKLENQESTLRSILDNTPAIISIKDSTGRYELVNFRFAEVVGIADEEDIIGKTDEELFDPETAQKLRESDFEVLKQKCALRFEEELPALGGKKMYLSSKFPLFGTGSTGLSICTISLDLSDRIESEKKLTLFKHIIAASNEGILIFSEQDESFHAEFVNQSFEAITSLSSDQLLGRSLSDTLRLLLESCSRSERDDLKRGILAGELHTSEVVCRSEDDKLRWYELRFTYLRNEKGVIIRVVMIVFDITTRKSNEETIINQQNELVKAGKLSVLGQMAAGIAHELNSPLNSIQGYVDVLEQLAGADELDHGTVREVAGHIEKTVENISSVISGLRSLAKMDQSELMVRYRVTDIISEGLRLCEYNLRNKGVKLRPREMPGDVFVKCLPVQLMQVVVNLVNNAAEAVKKLADKWIEIDMEANENSCSIRVIDSGEGISKQLAQKIMTPFFTTRKEGTGLGLSLSQSIIKSHGGLLTLDPTMRNTCFVVTLPVVNEEA